MKKRHEMKLFGKALLALSLGAAIAITPMAVEAKNNYTPKSSVWSADEWEVLRLTNEIRLSKKLQPLSSSSKLQKAAGIRADEIITSFAHLRLDGSQPYTVYPQVGLKYTSWGENIAGGQETPAKAITAWKNSPTHYANIIDSNNRGFKHIGCGTSMNTDSVHFWTQMYVGKCTVKSISVNGASSTKSYKKGTKIEDMNRYVMEKCDKHGTTYIPLSAKMCTGYNKNKVGTQTIKVKCNGKTTKFKVKITA